MTKQELISRMNEYGDAIITYRSEVSNKVKYNVCTIDFTTPYIAAKSTRTQETSDTVLMFAWDTDSFKLVKPAKIISVVPLSKVLNNA